jgi:hypothetical protein
LCGQRKEIEKLKYMHRNPESPLLAKNARNGAPTLRSPLRPTVMLLFHRQNV